MGYNHRSDGSWSTLTPRRRENGQWVPLGRGGGGTGDAREGVYSNAYYLPTGDPPTRSTTEYVSDYSGLQDALDSISSDTRLVIDTGNQTGNWSFPHTPEITLDGDGATLSRSNTDDQLLNGDLPGGEYDNSVDASGTYSPGQSSIAVASTSGFSVGDIIRIYDPDQQLLPDMNVDSGSDSGQGCYHVVADVGSGELTLEEDTVLTWDDPSGSLRVDNVDFQAVDQRITDIEFDGQDIDRVGDTQVVALRRRKDLWFDNCTVRNGRNGLWLRAGYRTRIDNCDFIDLGDSSTGTTYPLAIATGTHHTLVTGCTSLRGQRYGFKSGSGGAWWPCRNGRFVDCYAEGMTGGRRGYDQHPGSFNFDYFDCVSENGGMARPRSRGFHHEGTEVINPNQNCHYVREYARQYSAKGDHYYGDMGSHAVQVFIDHDLDYMRWEDVWAEPNGSLNSLLRFRHDYSGTFTCEELIIDHVAENGEWLTESRFQNNTSLSGDWEFPDVTINHPTDGTTPAAYFGDKYGW